MSTALTLHSQLPAALNPANSLESYLRYVQSIPMLTLEEEQQFAQDVHESNDLSAAQSLILPHLRFVVRIAKGFSGYGLALADLIQEGNIGLMKAVKRFDPKVGVRLVSFAVHWIKAEMHEFIIKNWRIVKVATTKAQRKLFFNLRNAKSRLGWFSREEVSAVAKDLGVKPEEVREMEQRMNSYHDVSFDIPDEAEDVPQFRPQEFLAAPASNPEEILEEYSTESLMKSKLKRGLELLDERAREIISARWLSEKKATLHELAAKYGVSAERIRQLEAQALKQLRSEF